MGKEGFSQAWKEQALEADAAAEQYYREFWDVETIADVEGEVEGEYPNDPADLTTFHLLDYLGVDKIVKTDVETVLVAQRFREHGTRGDDFSLRYNTGTDRPAELQKYLSALEGQGSFPGVYAFGRKDEDGDGFVYFHLIDFFQFLTSYAMGNLKTHTAPNYDGTKALYCGMPHLIEQGCVLQSWGSGWE